MTDNSPRKPWRETIPGYLAGFAAVATATISVLTFLSHRSAAPDSGPKDAPVTEHQPERRSEPAAAAPERRILAQSVRRDAAAMPVQNAAVPAPTLVEASRPNRCAPYLGAWRLSSGERITFFDGERFEIAASGAGAPKFGRWNCSGRDGESLYVTPERERTIVFTLAPDGSRLHQRTTKVAVTPLEAVRESD